LAEQIQGFSDYLRANPNPDFQADRVGYTETFFHASAEELDHLQAGLRKVVMEAAQNPPAEGRHRHKLAIITFPLFIGEKHNE
ncbi:MAG: hypothetical protein IH586_21135, partial [Anaerolineaceae bacterium]|nr:hypothetical protein [Anaerolineaceae bacterium]